MGYRRIVLAAAAAMGATASPALAQYGGDGPPSSGPLSLEVGGGAVVYPAFPGAGKYKVLPVPSVTASYKDRVFVAFPDLLRIDVLKVAGANTGGLSAGPLVGIRFGRNVKDDRSYLDGLANSGDTVEVGGYVQHAFSQSLTARVDVGQAVSGKQGLDATASINYSAPIGAVRFSVGPSVTFVDRNYARAYYGITPREASRSRFRAYAPDGGIERAGANATMVLPLSDRWALIGVASYARLVGDAADSPIARGRDGSRDQFNGALFISYRWK